MSSLLPAVRFCAQVGHHFRHDAFFYFCGFLLRKNKRPRPFSQVSTCCALLSTRRKTKQKLKKRLVCLCCATRAPKQDGIRPDASVSTFRTRTQRESIARRSQVVVAAHTAVQRHTQENLFTEVRANAKVDGEKKPNGFNTLFFAFR